MPEPPRKRSRTQRVISVQITGSGDTLLLLNVKADVTVGRLVSLWAQYLETLDENAAIDATRIQLVFAGRILQPNEAIDDIARDPPLVRLVASRKPLPSHPTTPQPPKVFRHERPVWPESPLSTPAPALPRFFNLKIHASDWSQPLHIKARPDMVVYKLKTFVAGRLGLEPGSIRLRHDADSEVVRDGCLGNVLAKHCYEEHEDVIFDVLLEQIGC